MVLRLGKKPGEEDEDQKFLKEAFLSGDEFDPGSFERLAQIGSQKITEFADEIRKSDAEKEAEAIQRAKENQAQIQSREIQNKAAAISAGDSTPIVKRVGEAGSTLDLNINNQEFSEDRRDSLLFSALDDDSNTTNIRQILAEDELQEKLSRDRMQKTLDDLKNRKSGIDLTPLAALIDEPNKAAILARTLSPAFSEEEKAEQILGLELKLQDRKDKYNSSRRSLRIALENQERKNDIDLINARLKAEEIKNKRDEKRQQQKEKAQIDSVKDFRSNVAKDDLKKYQDVTRIMDQLGDERNFDSEGRLNNAVVSELLTFDIAKSAAGAGQLSDQEREAVKGSKALVEKARRFFEKHGRGLIFTEEDQKMLAIGMSAAAKGVRARISDKAKKEAESLETVFGKRLDIKASDLISDGNIYDVERFAPISTVEKTDEFLKRSGIVEEASRKSETQDIDSEISRLEAEAAEIRRSLGGTRN